MGMSLLEYAKGAGLNTKRGTIIELFAKANSLLNAMTFETIKGSGVDYDQEATLPGVAFRGINEEYTASAGVINPMHDPLKIAGGTLDVDSALIKMFGEGVRSKHEGMKIKALSLKIAKMIIKGDSQADPKEFDGLQRRLANDQKICVTTNITDSVGALTLAKLDEAIDQTENPTHLVMNKKVRRLLTQASRTSTIGGYVTYTQDNWGRQVPLYADLPILDAGKDNTNTDIIPLTETAGDAGADSTSVYVVSFMDGMVEGIQHDAMDVKDLGLTDSGVIYRTLVEWLVGMALYHPRAATRLWNISTATAVTA
uniref:Putative capsid protein n=1 Tax=viral metagenome TaxID=1070528 RepID=A0A6M3LDZ6_9ZZZZ